MKHDPARRTASLKMVAEHVGLSSAAVSRVLSGSPAARSIPQATQERILAAAQQLNYRPNHLARSLRRGRSHTVGVLVPELSEGFATLVLAGLEQGLMQAGYFYNLVSHHHRADLLEQAQSMMIERAVDGFIAIDTVVHQPTQLPTVTISCPEIPQTGLSGKGEAVTSIVLNQRRAAELAMDHLIGLGHRQIAFIKGQSFSSDTDRRWQAIEQAAARAKMKINPALVVQLEGESPSHEPGYFAAQRLLASKAPFTAIFAFNDISAIGAVRALHEADLRVPEDVSIVGFDDVQSAAFQNPALTTVRQPLRTMGMLAAEAIVRQIEASGPEPGAGAGAGSGSQARRIVVDPELVVRESTAPVKKAARPPAGHAPETV